MVKKTVLDIVGIGISASATPMEKTLSQYYFMNPQTSQATAWTKTFAKGNAQDVAAFNASMGHLFDVDDTHLAAIAHIGIVTVPAAIAVAQMHKRSGQACIAAIAAGYELAARAGEMINPSSYHCWHTTGVVGTLSAGVASGKLMNLTKEQLLHCIGTAGTQSAGIWEFINNGSNSKILHTAHANLCGIRSATLAGLGFTGATRLFEGNRGFAKAFAREYDLEALNRDLDVQHLKILENCFKPYACCRHCHPGIYCAQSLVTTKEINLARIASITVYTYKIANVHTNNPHPENLYKYKFSLQYCVAAQLYYGHLEESAFTQEATQCPEVVALMKKVCVVVDAQLDEGFCKENKWAQKVVIKTTTGAVYQDQISYPYGDYRNPVDSTFLANRFYRTTTPIIGQDAAEHLVEQIMRLEQLDDVNLLFPQRSSL